MGTMTCVVCNKTWYEKGFSTSTICDECKQKQLNDRLSSSDFKQMVCNILLDEEIEALEGVDWDELKLIAAEYIALQLRWKLLTLKKGSDK